MATSDFVNVELSSGGTQAVGANGAIRFTRRRMNYLFKPGVPVRVLTSEWSAVLSKQLTGTQPILQVATPAHAAAAAAAPLPAATAAADPQEAKLNELRAEEAAVEAEIAKKPKGGK